MLKVVFKMDSFHWEGTGGYGVWKGDVKGRRRSRFGGAGNLYNGILFERKSTSLLKNKIRYESECLERENKFL